MPQQWFWENPLGDLSVWSLIQNSLSMGGWKYACKVVKEACWEEESVIKRYTEAGVSSHSHTIYASHQISRAGHQKKSITWSCAGIAILQKLTVAPVLSICGEVLFYFQFSMTRRRKKGWGGGILIIEARLETVLAGWKIHHPTFIFFSSWSTIAWAEDLAYPS